MANDANKRLHDPIGVDDYLTQWETHLDGSSTQRNFKQGQEGAVYAQINGDGEYSAEQFNVDGSRSFIVQGDNKEAANSSTRTINNGEDAHIAGSYYFRAGDGVMNETGGHFSAHDGPQITATAEGHKTFAEGGDGQHVMQGDQTFVCENGRMDIFSAGYTITSGKTVEFKSTEDLLIETAASSSVKADQNFSADALMSVKIKAGVSANVICGICELGMTTATAKLSVGPLTSISMNPGSITVRCGASIIEMTPAGIAIAAPTFNVQAAAGININAGAAIVVSSEAEAAFIGDASVQVGSGGTATIAAPSVFIG